MSHDYKVIAEGHIHAGRALHVGDVISLDAAVAAKYPATFKAIKPEPIFKRAPSPKAERGARQSTANKED